MWIILSASIASDKSSNAGCAKSKKSSGLNNSGDEVGSATQITSTPTSLNASTNSVCASNATSTTSSTTKLSVFIFP